MVLNAGTVHTASDVQGADSKLDAETGHPLFGRVDMRMDITTGGRVVEV